MATLPQYGARATDVIDAMLPESARDAMQIAEQRRISTDPKWLAPASATITVQATVPTSVLSDGRNRRSTATKRDLLKACRELMVGGVFRPTMEEVCELARRSVRSGFQHFAGLEALHLAAARDAQTRDRILEQVIGADWEIALAWGAGENVADRLVRTIIRGKV